MKKLKIAGLFFLILAVALACAPTGGGAEVPPTETPAPTLSPTQAPTLGPPAPTKGPEIQTQEAEKPVETPEIPGYMQTIEAGHDFIISRKCPPGSDSTAIELYINLDGSGPKGASIRGVDGLLQEGDEIIRVVKCNDEGEGVPYRFGMIIEIRYNSVDVWVYTPPLPVQGSDL
ncbi:hypothetical protein JW710_00915 [Candidatus Dojkabacteria bacterium]|nr:hypothetical protein [Candidatus Dojkabacteria bacterium]